MSKIAYDPDSLAVVLARLADVTKRVGELSKRMKKEEIPTLRLDFEGKKNRGFEDIETWLDDAETQLDRVSRQRLHAGNWARVLILDHRRTGSPDEIRCAGAGGMPKARPHQSQEGGSDD